MVSLLFTHHYPKYYSTDDHCVFVEIYKVVNQSTVGGGEDDDIYGGAGGSTKDQT